MPNLVAVQQTEPFERGDQGCGKNSCSEAPPFGWVEIGLQYSSSGCNWPKWKVKIFVLDVKRFWSQCAQKWTYLLTY